MRDEPATHGFIAATGPCPFRGTVSIRLSRHYLDDREASEISFPTRSSPSEFLRSESSPATFRFRARPTWVSSLFAASPARVHSPRGFPILVTFRPQVFSTSRRFPPRAGSRAYFIPLPRPGSSCSRSSPFTQPSSLVGRSVPPCRCPPSAHRPKSAATDRDLGFEALIWVKMRSTG